ncbi:MAG: hypothetical protein FJ197_04860 [Gammaproteobacteria bacterium]|nr:hypothetical protein [Gammaproteobacteria bacterium]
MPATAFTYFAACGKTLPPGSVTGLVLPTIRDERHVTAGGNSRNAESGESFVKQPALTPSPGRSSPLPRLRFSALYAMVALMAVALLVALAVPARQDTLSVTRQAEVRAMAAIVSGAELVVRRGRVAMVNGWPSPGGVGLLLEDAELMGFTLSNAGVLQHRGASRDAGCRVRYAAPLQLGAEPVIESALEDC